MKRHITLFALIPLIGCISEPCPKPPPGPARYDQVTLDAHERQIEELYRLIGKRNADLDIARAEATKWKSEYERLSEVLDSMPDDKEALARRITELEAKIDETEAKKKALELTLNEIKRGPTFVGKLMVEKVDSRRSVCRIIPGVTIREIQVGDRVCTHTN